MIYVGRTSWSAFLPAESRPRLIRRQTGRSTHAVYNVSVSASNPLKLSPRPQSTKTRAGLWLALALMLGSAGAVWFFYAHGWLLYYGDAEAHLNGARRVFDSQTPGYDQLGPPWLPLLHVLMLPFVRNDSLVAQRAGRRHSARRLFRNGGVVPVCGGAAHLPLHARRAGGRRAVRLAIPTCCTSSPPP